MDPDNKLRITFISFMLIFFFMGVYIGTELDRIELDRIEFEMVKIMENEPTITQVSFSEVLWTGLGLLILTFLCYGVYWFFTWHDRIGKTTQNNTEVKKE